MKADYIACYIYDVNTGTSVNFDVEVPETISDSYNAVYADQPTIGRSSPFKAYKNSGPRSISFSVRLAIDYRRDIVAVVDSLRNMMKPAKAEYIIPPRVRLKMGTMLYIEAVPKSFTAEWSAGYIQQTYRICDCSFSFDEVEDVGTFDTNSAQIYQYQQTNMVPNKKPIREFKVGPDGESPAVSPTDEDFSNLLVGDEINYTAGLHAYRFKEDAVDPSAPFDLKLTAGYSTIYAKYKSAVKIKYADGEYYWVVPYKEG